MFGYGLVRVYHIDYCFMSENLIKNLQTVEVGAHEEFGKKSDHMPLRVVFNID